MSRLTVRRWLPTIIVVAAVLLALLATGGFAPARSRAPEKAVGEWFSTKRWDVRVDGCSIVESFGTPQVRIDLTVRNTWNESQTEISNDAVRVELPDARRYGISGERLWITSPNRVPQFDPQLTYAARYSIDVTPDQLTGDHRFVVAFANERYEESTNLDGWVHDGFAGVVHPECPQEVA